MLSSQSCRGNETFLTLFLVDVVGIDRGVGGGLWGGKMSMSAWHFIPFYWPFFSPQRLCLLASSFLRDSPHFSGPFFPAPTPLSQRLCLAASWLSFIPTSGSVWASTNFLRLLFFYHLWPSFFGFLCELFREVEQ